MKQIKWVKNTMPKTDDANLRLWHLKKLKNPQHFHKTIPGI